MISPIDFFNIVNAATCITTASTHLVDATNDIARHILKNGPAFA
jgi:hypothetical protein